MNQQQQQPQQLQSQPQQQQQQQQQQPQQQQQQLQQQPQQQIPPPAQPQINEDQKRSNEENEDENQSNEGFVVKMRGLPWSATADDIIKFLSILGEAKVKGGAAGVHLTMAREGRPSGEAYVEMESEEDLKAALKKDREHMGNRYIEVFRSKRSEMEWVIKKTGSTLDSVLDDNCVRLRGLPFGSTKDDIIQFFQGLEMTTDGITIATDFTGRSTGEAFVQFVDRENAEKALQKHKEKIGHRYIEIFRSSLAEIRNQALQRRPRQTPYDRMDRFGNSGGSGGGSGGRYFDMPMRAGRNMKSFGNNGYDNGGGPWNNGRNMGGPRGGGGSGQGMMGGGGGGGWNSNNWNAPPSRPLYVVHMRGLPFKAHEDDIAAFFEPLVPVEIVILFNNNNRPSGEANVEFSNKEDAMRAMSKDKTYMQHRYIELFMDGPVGGGPGAGGNNFSMDDMGPPNTGNSGNFGGFGNNSFGGSGGGGGGGNSFGNNSFSRRNENSGPPNTFFSNNMGGGGYPRPSGPRNMSGPGPKFNLF